VSRYRRWNELLELLAAAGQLQVEDAEALGMSAATNRLTARQASQVIIVADSSKVGRRAFARICTAQEIDVLVTDKDIAAEDASRLQDAGVDVVTA
jgi:DeoR/GlpR family transcriptional regulator of sugar metabolism